MKKLISFILLAALIVSLSTGAYAQSEGQKPSIRAGRLTMGYDRINEKAWILLLGEHGQLAKYSEDITVWSATSPSQIASTGIDTSSWVYIGDAGSIVPIYKVTNYGDTAADTLEFKLAFQFGDIDQNVLWSSSDATKQDSLFTQTTFLTDSAKWIYNDESSSSIEKHMPYIRFIRTGGAYNDSSEVEMKLLKQW